MGQYILCIDNGLTTTKSVIFTLDGTEVASSLLHTVLENKHDFSEIDMNLQWENTAKVIKETIQQSGIDPSEIIGVGNSGHGAGLYCLDIHQQPVRKAISSMDSRVNILLEKWDKSGMTTFPLLYQNLWSGQAIPLLYWLRENEPENYLAIRYAIMVKDWIIYKLTDTIGLERTDASNSGILNPLTREVDLDLLRMFDLEDACAKFPPLRECTDISGVVTPAASEETGLMAGTRVISGVFDVVACALGSGVYDHKAYSLIAGTWNVNLAIVSQPSQLYETTKYTLFAEEGKYACVESSATSAVNLEWFIDRVLKRFSGEGAANAQLHKMIDNEIEKMKPEDSDVLYTPFLYKSNLVKSMDGAFVGLKAHHDVYDMLRAIYEGVVFAHCMHIDNLNRSGIARDHVILSGGASNSDVWCQMFADVLNRDVAVTGTSQVGALGTAICVATAMGKYANMEEAILTMVRYKKKYIPDPDRHAVYMQKYDRFIQFVAQYQ